MFGFKKKNKYTNILAELKEGRIYILFLPDERSAEEYHRAFGVVFAGMQNPPKVIIAPVGDIKPRMLRFD